MMYSMSGRLRILSIIKIARRHGESVGGRATRAKINQLNDGEDHFSAEVTPMKPHLVMKKN